MDLTLVYALVLLGNITFVVLLNAAHTLYRKLSWKIKLWNLAYLRCHFSITRRKYLQSVTIAKALLFVGLLVGLALLNAIGLNDRTEARRRTGLLCIIHAVPLYITAHMGLAADILGIKLSRMRLFHTLAGLVCCFEGIAHVILSIDTIPVREGVGLFGLLAQLTLGLLTLLPFGKKLAHEAFAMTHSLLAAALLVTTWFHIKLYRSRYLVLASVGLLIALTAFRLTRTLVRCCSLSRDRTITISRISARTFASDLVKVEVELARPWKVTPGQYAHLTLPSLYSNSWLQSHPFMIVAWYDDHGRDTSRPATRLEMIVRPAKGWTEYGLCPLTRPTISRFRTALIDGPYGTGRDLGQYGTVIMVASGMGIFAHIPYIKGLFEGYRQARIRTRRLRIYWQIEYDRCTEWSQKWMNDFLRQDNLGHHEEEASFLQTSIFVLKEDDGSPAPSKMGTAKAHGTNEARIKEHVSSTAHTQREVGRRLRAFKGPLNVVALVEDEILKGTPSSHGGLAIAVSAEAHLRDELREALGRIGSRAGFTGRGAEIFPYLRGVDLIELDYQPQEEPLPRDPSFSEEPDRV